MLVRGVWRLWLTPRRKSSLAASSSRSWAFWASTCANSWALRIARRDLAREQLEEVLVGPLPPPRGRQPAGKHTKSLAARPQLGAQRSSLTRDHFLERHAGGIHEPDVGVEQAERLPGIRRRPTDEGRSTSRRARPADRPPGGSARARGSAARGRRRAGCGSRPGGPARRPRTCGDRRSEVARGNPVDGSRQGAERLRQVRREEVGEEDGQQHGHDDDEQDDAGERRVTADDTEPRLGRTRHRPAAGELRRRGRS